MAHEVPIRQDPNLYNPRNIFGMFDARTFAVAVAIVAVVTPVVVATVKFDLPSEATTVAGMALVAPIALVGLVKRHGMHTERWMPLVTSERNAPEELRWEPDRIVYAAAAPAKPTRAERREAKRDARARKKENELEGAALDEALKGAE